MLRPVAGRFRFTRTGVEYAGSGSDMFAGAVRARFYLSQQGQDIVDVLTNVMVASVLLYDAETRTHHLAMRDGWISNQRSRPGIPRRCRLQARINDRWTLLVGARRPLHPDAETIVQWAARHLTAHVPDKTTQEPVYPGPGGGGGSGSAAEIGIPVWWARKARN
jgi:hypothetical protein